jgi:large subunit ribosomal protein L23
MGKKNVLIQPLITEKSEAMSNTLNKYCFQVERKSNKIEIKKAVEAMYNVAVNKVNTLVVPGKIKSRSTRTGVVKGRQSPYKKAYVTLAEGEQIDFFSDL